MSDLVGNPVDPFSSVVAQSILVPSVIDKQSQNSIDFSIDIDKHKSRIKYMSLRQCFCYVKIAI